MITGTPTPTTTPATIFLFFELKPWCFPAFVEKEVCVEVKVRNTCVTTTWPLDVYVDKVSEVEGFIDEVLEEKEVVLLELEEELEEELELEIFDELVIGRVEMLLDVNIGVIDEKVLLEVLVFEAIGDVEVEELEELVLTELVNKLKLEEELWVIKELLDDEKELEDSDTLLDGVKLVVMKELVGLLEEELWDDELLNSKFWADTTNLVMNRHDNKSVWKILETMFFLSLLFLIIRSYKFGNKKKEKTWNLFKKM